ncbi:CopD family copper resistance protein [Basilea psittacipulmonis]|uniref:Membrane protein n=1 Tax=Basilea psittacipulmonis DSM 24701 TaxID=1072685 RepID=A0A077DBB6_9BURK|nr:membrane protein [Basilea psittacipulmonis]AIL31954.1 membrane protein [Basilea psittacipulmonis DSM 24701]
MNYYAFAQTLHLYAAIMFVGTVFFEVLIMEGVRKRVSVEFMRDMEKVLGKRIREIIPFALLVLYGSGLAMIALRYTDVLHHPFQSSFGTLLLIKIILATSVFGHFLTAMILIKRHRLNKFRNHVIHTSVFIHVLLIVFLAKGMFFIHL